MKMPRFCYHRPRSTEEALHLLAEHGDEAKILAGGQSLLPLMALRLSQPAHVIDIGHVADFAGIDERDGSVVIGAIVRHADVEHSALVASSAPLVSAAVPFIGHRAIRNMGTACGSLAHADPAGELPAVALALDAELVVRRLDGERTIPAADFFLGYLDSDIGDGELLSELRLPPWSPSAGWSVQEVSRRHGDYALLGLAAVVDSDSSGRIRGAALSLFGAGSTPVRTPDAEQLLAGQPPSEELFRAAGDAVMRGIDPPADNHATTAYRRHVAGVLTRRCLTEATQRMGVRA